MPESFDVIVVGARCAGSPLAALLARRGVSVAVVEQTTFPRDTLSTHNLQAQALAFLDRLGVTEKIRATGAPVIDHYQVRLEDLEYRAPIPQLPGDAGGGASVRRMLLDPILAEAAVDAGADLRLATKVTELVHDCGRVTGVRVSQGGRESTLNARLVVGADGRNSTVARAVGARKYDLTPSERFIYWSFFEDADPECDSAFIYHHWGNRLVLATLADSALYQVIVLPDLGELPRFRRDLDGSFMEYASSCRPVGRALADAHRVGRFFGILRWEGFFREGSGPGWVLVGDAGHFKDPTPGQGIQDAFRQVDALAPAIVGYLEQPEERGDRELAGWARWRNEDAIEHYWLATDMGKAGPLPRVQPEITRGLLRGGRIDLVTDLYTHRSRPSEVLTPQRLLAATGRLLARRGCDRLALLREVAGLAAQDLHRRRQRRRSPRYLPGGTHSDSGATEVDNEATAVPA